MMEYIVFSPRQFPTHQLLLFFKVLLPLENEFSSTDVTPLENWLDLELDFSSVLVFLFSTEHECRKKRL